MQPPNIVIQTGGEHFAPAFSAQLGFTAATLRAALYDVIVDTARIFNAVGDQANFRTAHALISATPIAAKSTRCCLVAAAAPLMR